MKNNRLTQEELDFIKDNCVGRYNQELADMFNKKFNKNVTAHQMKDYKSLHGWRSGIDTRLKKGEFVNPRPPKPLYSEMVCYNNGIKIIYIKTGKNKWEKKHLYMYKKYHGSIPKNCNVIFLDGDRDNFNEENLVCIPRQQHRIMAGNNLYFNDKELNNTALMVAELIEKVKEVS